MGFSKKLRRWARFCGQMPGVNCHNQDTEQLELEKKIVLYKREAIEENMMTLLFMDTAAIKEGQTQLCELEEMGRILEQKLASVKSGWDQPKYLLSSLDEMPKYLKPSSRYQTMRLPAKKTERPVYPFEKRGTTKLYREPEMKDKHNIETACMADFARAASDGRMVFSPRKAAERGLVTGPEGKMTTVRSITDGDLKIVEGELFKGILENNKCYLVGCGAEVFLWVGHVTQLEDRNAASQAAEEFAASQNRTKSTNITQLIQGYETHSFKSNFDSWPSGAAAPGAEEGRGKVAALLKQQGVCVKGMTKSAPVNEAIPPLLEGGGKTEVWHINFGTKTALPKEDIGRFYSGDCYIILYTYHLGDRKEDFFLCCWIGKDSIEDDQKMAARLASTMSNSLEGRPVQGRIFQGKEPPQFIALFQPMVVLKGGLSSGYKKHLAEKGSPDETYTSDGVALFRISGTSVHNNKIVQVDPVATSLNSTECFLLQSGSSVFIWHGNQSTLEQQQFAAKVAEFLKIQPGVALKHSKEGTECSSFWFPLGGKQSYSGKKVSPEIVRDPHLFAFFFNKGKFQVEEIYNFSQDDLLTEVILVLDTHTEVFVWVGHSVDPKEKQNAFDFGQRYIEMAASVEVSPNVPLYIVTEGNEPSFFTTHFSWDPAKASSPGRSNGSSQGGPTQRASALAAFSSAFNSSSATKNPPRRPSGMSQGSHRAAAAAALPSVLTAEKKQTREVSPLQSPPSEPYRPVAAEGRSKTPEAEGSEEFSEVKDNEYFASVSESMGEESEPKQEAEQDENGSGSSLSTSAMIS